MNILDFYLPIVGFITGFIDSIAGGGGLISIPFLSHFIEPGPLTIGTNKVVALSAALMAYLIYSSKRKFSWYYATYFLISVAISSSLGATLSPLFPKYLFHWLILLSCPLLLWIIFKKDFLLKNAMHSGHQPKISSLLIWGILVGFYDGFYGPGGGTFMLIILLWKVRLPLIDSLLLSKLANSLSAATSLATYALQGKVLWREGIIMSIGVLIGSFVGASLNKRYSLSFVRPLLLVIIFLLMFSLFLKIFY